MRLERSSTKKQPIDIAHEIGVKAPVPAVYEALSTLPGLARWWTMDTTRDSRVGGRIRFWFANRDGGERGAGDAPLAHSLRRRMDEAQITLKWNRELHRRISRMGGNKILSGIYLTLLDDVERTTAAARLHPPPPEEGPRIEVGPGKPYEKAVRT